MDGLSARGVKVWEADEGSLNVNLRATQVVHYLPLSGFTYEYTEGDWVTLTPAPSVEKSEVIALAQLAQSLAKAEHIPVMTAHSVLLLAPSYLERGALVQLVPPQADDPVYLVRFLGSSGRASLIFKGIDRLLGAWPVYQPVFHIADAPVGKQELLMARARPTLFLQYPPSGDASAFVEEETTFFPSPAAVFYHDAFHAALAGLNDLPRLMRPYQLGGLDATDSTALTPPNASGSTWQRIFASGSLDPVNEDRDGYQLINSDMLSLEYTHALFQLATRELSETQLAMFFESLSEASAALRVGPRLWPAKLGMLSDYYLEGYHAALPQRFRKGPEEEMASKDFWAARNLAFPVPPEFILSQPDNAP